MPVPLSEAEAKQLLIDNMMRYDLPPDPWPEAGSYFWGGHAGPPPYDFRKASVAVTRGYIGAYGKYGEATTSRWGCPTCARPRAARGAPPS